MEERIIKARLQAELSGAPADAPKIVKKELYEAGVDARKIIDDARRQAAGILEDAERQRNSILEAARREGYEQGLSQWHQALAAATSATQELYANCESEVIRLSVRIAEKIIGEELNLRPETIVSIVREALKSIRHERTLTIQVNPKDTDRVKLRLERLQEAAGAGRELRVVGDPAVTPGGCLVESELGVIDAQLETQLKCLEENLLRAARK